MSPTLDSWQKSLYGRSRAESHEASRCIRCWSPVDPSSLGLLDANEYRITAFCPACFEEVTEEPDE